MPLIVDAAWGAAYGFSCRLPTSPMHEGADVVVCSVHKTMAALAQGSIMLLKGERIDKQRFALTYELFETTSPSVAVLASLDATRRDHALHGEAKWARVVRQGRRARERLAAVPGVRVMGREVLHRPGAHDLDKTKVLVDVSALGLTGYEADDWLQRHHRVSVGMSDARHLLAIFCVGVTRAEARRLTDAVSALSRARSGHKPTNAFKASREAPSAAGLQVDMAMRAADAFAEKAQMVSYDKAADRIAAEIIAPAPPGIPRLIPGQRITSAHVEFLTCNTRAGVFILDPADPDQSKLRVVAA